jgi:putative inorganic carbon (hco3(-)) transporter
MVVVAAVRLHEIVPGIAVLQPAFLSTVGTVGLLVLFAPRSTIISVLQHRLMKLTLGYWLFMIVTVPFAIWPGGSIPAIKYFLPGVVLVFAVLTAAQQQQSLRLVYVALVGTTGIYAAYALMYGQVFANDRLAPGFGMYDSNDMAALAALVVPLSIGLLRSEEGWRKIPFAAITVLLVLAIVASGSRGGALGLAAGLTVLALGIRGEKRFAAVAVLVVGVMGVWTASPALQDRMRTLTNLEEDYNTFALEGRQEVWKRGAGYVFQNPLLGVGVGNFPNAEGRFFHDYYGGLRGAKWSNAHNAYVQTYAELGIIGGTIFVALLLYGLRRSFRLWRGTGPAPHRPELFASLCAFVVTAVFLSHAYFIPLFVVLALIGGYEGPARLSRARSNRPSTPRRSRCESRIEGTGAVLGGNLQRS